jgi:multisubunit Na+/H+ antiporter MnhB subunit
LKAVNYLLLGLFTALLVYASASLPWRGDPNAPVHRRSSLAGTQVAGDYYLSNALSDAATPNVVTVVLADYRGFDTFGEALVVFTAGIACFLILRRPTS